MSRLTQVGVFEREENMLEAIAESRKLEIGRAHV